MALNNLLSGKKTIALLKLKSGYRPTIQKDSFERPHQVYAMYVSRKTDQN